MHKSFWSCCHSIILKFQKHTPSHAHTSLTFNLCVPHTPGWDCGSYFPLTGPGQRNGGRLIFWPLWGGRGGVEDTGWAATLTGWWGCRWEPRCRDVQGVCVCGSNDKHQWESERRDGNLAQEVKLYHCRRNHRREADLVRLCWAAALFERGPGLKPAADRKVLWQSTSLLKSQWKVSGGNIQTEKIF